MVSPLLGKRAAWKSSGEQRNSGGKDTAKRRKTDGWLVKPCPWVRGFDGSSQPRGTVAAACHVFVNIYEPRLHESSAIGVGLRLQGRRGK